MLRESPKKDKNYANPTKGQLFWRVQGECWLRAATSYVMYLFMSMIALTMQAISGENTLWLRIALGASFILCGAAYNGFLCYNRGQKHYESLLLGKIYRRNAALGIETGGTYRAHQEYRVWKGFLIGGIVSLPAIVMGIISAFTDELNFVYLVAAGWAYLPLTWARAIAQKTFGEGATVNGAWSLVMIFVPVLVSGICYILGARRKKAETEALEARTAEVERLQREQQLRQEEERLRAEKKRKEARTEKRK